MALGALSGSCGARGAGPDDAETRSSRDCAELCVALVGRVCAGADVAVAARPVRWAAFEDAPSVTAGAFCAASPLALRPPAPRDPLDRGPDRTLPRHPHRGRGPRVSDAPRGRTLAARRTLRLPVSRLTPQRGGHLAARPRRAGAGPFSSRAYPLAMRGKIVSRLHPRYRETTAFRLASTLPPRWAAGRPPRTKGLLDRPGVPDPAHGRTRQAATGRTSRPCRWTTRRPCRCWPRFEGAGQRNHPVKPADRLAIHSTWRCAPVRRARVAGSTPMRWSMRAASCRTSLSRHHIPTRTGRLSLGITSLRAPLQALRAWPAPARRWRVRPRVDEADLLTAVELVFAPRCDARCPRRPPSKNRPNRRKRMTVPKMAAKTAKPRTTRRMSPPR